MFEEPKDMFDGVVKAPASGPVPVAPIAPSAPAPIAPPPTNLPQGYGYGGQAAPMPMLSEPHRGGMGKMVIIVAVILVVFGVSGFFAYRIMVQPANDSSVVDSVSDTGVISDTAKDPKAGTDTTGGGSTSAPVDTTVPATTPPATTTSNPASLLDSDGDGLTNARELELGTSVTKSDTDGDGLGDREEVEVYGTNPRKTDTDGDGYLDGQEVAGGYNPNGEGKLFGTVPSGS